MDLIYPPADHSCFGLIWTSLVPNRNVIFFLKIVSYGQISASRYKLLNLKKKKPPAPHKPGLCS